MSRFAKTPEVPPEFAGKWVAWNRQQTQIVGVDDSFEAAKHAAAAAGYSEVVIGGVSPASRWRKFGLHAFCMVAVFISQLPSGLTDLSDLGL